MSKGGKTMSDYTFHEKVVVKVQDAIDFEKNLYVAAGMREEDALVVADHLVTADARGVYSHGIQRNNIYLKRFREGGTDPKGVSRIIKEKKATCLIDGGNSMGMVTGKFAMEKAISLAKEYGTSTVSVTGSNHFGTCAYYVQMAADQGMIGMMWTINCGNIMAPWGGTERQLGNNPFGIGIPCKRHPTVILDSATSVVARGKIVVAMKTHSPIPEGWALDKNGNPTTDAEEGYWGTVLPFGGYKGYGLTFTNACLAAILNNSAFGPSIVDFYEEPGKIQNNGYLFQVIDIDSFDDVDAFEKRMDDAVDFIKGGKKADGVDEIFVPGEIEYNARKKALAEGIVYPVEIVGESNGFAEDLGITDRLIGEKEV